MALARAFHHRIESLPDKWMIYRQTLNYKTLQQYTDSIKLKNDFSYLSYTSLMNKKGLLKHCELENYYQSLQQHALYPAITWHLYLYQCKGMG